MDIRTHSGSPTVPRNPEEPAYTRPRSHCQHLLQLRINKGCRVIDALCHAETNLARLHAESNLLDDSLEGYPRYRRDRELLVHPAEERRFHVPGLNQPADGFAHPCLLCRAEAAAEAASASASAVPKQDAAA